MATTQKKKRARTEKQTVSFSNTDTKTLVSSSVQEKEQHQRNAQEMCNIIRQNTYKTCSLLCLLVYIAMKTGKLKDRSRRKSRKKISHVIPDSTQHPDLNKGPKRKLSSQSYTTSDSTHNSTKTNDSMYTVPVDMVFETFKKVQDTHSISMLHDLVASSKRLDYVITQLITDLTEIHIATPTDKTKLGLNFCRLYAETVQTCARKIIVEASLKDMKPNQQPDKPLGHIITDISNNLQTRLLQICAFIHKRKTPRDRV